LSADYFKAENIIIAQNPQLSSRGAVRSLGGQTARNKANLLAGVKNVKQ
jgi:hypothetical protein